MTIRDVPLIPRRILFDNPDRVLPSISSDGSRLAWLAPVDGVLNVWVKTLDQDDGRPVTKDKHRGIRGYYWAFNNRQLIYVQDRDGDENWHVYCVTVDGSDAVDLTPLDGIQARIVAISRECPDEILVGVNDRLPQLHDVFRVDLRTGERTRVALNDLNVTEWLADNRLRVRIAQTPTTNGGFALHHRRTNDDPWELLLEWERDDALSTTPLAFSGDNETLYLLSSIDSNSAQLRQLNVKTGVQSTIAFDPIYDVGEVLLHPVSHRVQAVSFERDRRDWLVVDPDIEDDFKLVREIHHGDFRVSNRDLSDHSWVVSYLQDDGPVVYYTYDRTTRRSEFLFSTRSRLAGWRLSNMEPVRYKSRDGLDIHGYLTLPPSERPARLPAILKIHGGPWTRDSWGYDPDVQWLANRGYAVLQINYRGSIGYGKSFINAGDREWGGAMQDDISDGALWLVEQGIADPQRLGIFGGSYGGYAVLSALTKTPDLFKCGVDVVGPSNLITFQRTIPPYWEPVRELMYQRIGHPDQDRELLEARSPLNHVSKIVAPLMIVQGKNDPRVKRAESIQIRDALLTAGKVVEYLEFEDEGHGFVRPENRMVFYAAAERFLATHLGGRSEGESAKA